MEIITRYKIQAALKRSNSENKEVENSHFWRLIKEYTHENGDTTPEIEDVCDKNFYGIWHTSSASQPLPNSQTSIIKPTYTHIVYGDRMTETDAKDRWNKAIKQISQFLAIITLKQRPDLFYQYFASMLGVEAYSLIEKAFLGKHPSYNMLSSTIEYPISVGIRYKIKAAMHCIVLKYSHFTLRPFPVDYLRAGHHFWMLVAEELGQEHIIETLHGLATRYDNPEKPERVLLAESPLRSWGAYLKIYCITPPIQDTHAKITTFEQQKNFDHDWISPDKSQVVYGDLPDQNALWLWRQAHVLMKDFNQQGPFLYSFLGLGKTLGLQATNSNSIYATLALGLNLPIYRFKGYLAPGINKPILSSAGMQIQSSSLKNRR